MVDISSTPRRGPGRPRAFDPDTALDRAVEVFWREGYEGADTETLARAMGVTKPSIYSTFGTKEQLFLKALARYGATVGAEPLQTLLAAPDVRTGVAAFFETVARNASGTHGATGCLIGCVAAQCSGTQPDVRTFYESVLSATDQAIGAALEKGVTSGELPTYFPVGLAARLATDLMLSLSLRARAGVPLSELLRFAENNASFVLAAGATRGGEA